MAGRRYFKSLIRPDPATDATLAQFVREARASLRSDQVEIHVGPSDTKGGWILSAYATPVPETD